jgi:hypothetical protein
MGFEKRDYLRIKSFRKPFVKCFRWEGVVPRRDYTCNQRCSQNDCPKANAGRKRHYHRTVYLVWDRGGTSSLLDWSHENNRNSKNFDHD